MKVRKLLLGLGITALGLAGAAALKLTVDKQGSDPVEADASYITLTSGLYYKVESVSDIHIGDEIIFVSADSGYIFDDIWGNPGYLHATNSGILRTNTRHLAYLTDCPVAVFTVGTSDYAAQYEGDIYTFKTGMAMTSTDKDDEVYLAQNKKDFPFAGMAQLWEDGFGVESGQENGNSTGAKESNTNWRLKAYENGIGVEHVKGGELRYFSGLGRFCRSPNMYGHYSPYYKEEAHIYKRFVEEGTSSYSIQIVNEDEQGTHEFKTVYKHGEEIDLSGMRIRFSLTQSGSVVFSESYDYSSNPKMFAYDKYAYGNGYVTLNISFAGKAFTTSIFVDRTPESTERIVGDRHDYRGTYMLVVENPGNSYAVTGEQVEVGKDYVLNTASLVSPAGKSERRVAQDSAKDNLVRFEVYRNSEYPQYYSLKCVGNPDYPYVCFNVNDNMSMHWDDTEVSERVQLEYDGVGIRIKGVDNTYLYYDNDGWIRHGSSSAGMPIYLWKYGTTDAELAEVNTFVRNFLAATDVCDGDGKENRITKAIWKAQREAFLALSPEAQGLLADVTYTPYGERARSIEEAMNRYDCITSKYLLVSDDNDYVLDDFISRKLAGTNPNPQSSQMARESLFNNDRGMLVALLVGVGIATAAVLGIVVSKKKKEN